APSTVVHRVVGTPTERVIPFGAFRTLLAGADMAETGRPAELLRAAQEYLAGGDTRRLFVIDDAHHLDHLSATLIYQLALSGSARLIVAARSGAELPAAVAALWADGLLTRIEVGPLDAAATAALLETPDDELAARSKGNPLALRLLVQADGAPKDATLPALVDGYLSGLPSPVRTLLDYLSVAEPLRRSDLTALTGEEAVDQAEAAGAVAVDSDAMVYAGHPLYAGRAGVALSADA